MSETTAELHAAAAIERAKLQIPLTESEVALFNVAFSCGAVWANGNMLKLIDEKRTK